MRFTLALRINPYYQTFKALHKRKQRYTSGRDDLPLDLPPVVAAKAVVVVDALELTGVRRNQRAADASQAFQPSAETELASLQPNSYVYTYPGQLHGGLQQVQILTRSVLYDHLPHCVNNLVGRYHVKDQDQLMQKSIMQSHEWLPDNDLCEKRFIPATPTINYARRVGITHEKMLQMMLDSVIRVCSRLTAQHPALQLERYFRKEFSTCVRLPYHGGTGGISELRIKGTHPLLTTGIRPLHVFENEAGVQALRDAVLPSISPLLPTIDIQKANDHTREYLDLREGEHPHTLYLKNSERRMTMAEWQRLPFTSEQQLARGLLFLHGIAATHAHANYGADVGDLPEPVCVQCVQTDGSSFHIQCYQLNTLSSESSLRNQCWQEQDLALFLIERPRKELHWSKVLPNIYMDYEPSVLEKLMAVYVNGVDMNAPLSSFIEP